MGYMCRAMGKTTIKAHHALRVNLEIFLYYLQDRNDSKSAVYQPDRSGVC